MKTRNVYMNVVKAVWNVIRKFSLAVVSGFPSQRISMTPERKSGIITRSGNFPKDREKHYHRPFSRPAVEKQTLLKESRKQKANQVSGR
jgi:hypothetical protein